MVGFSQITPQPSPGASLSQTIGITKVNLEYSRPGVKTRKIFGGLVPFGEVWRTGANEPTQISFSTDVTVNYMPIKAGRYAILTIPNSSDWTIIFSYDLEVTEDTYNPMNDALTIVTKPMSNPFAETFTIDLSEVKEDKSNLNIYWENTKVTLQIGVDNEESIVYAMQLKSLETAAAFMQAAEYMVNKNMDLNIALEYIEKSIAIEQTFRNSWIKAVIMSKKGDFKNALTFAQIAQKLGNEDPVYQLFKDSIENAIADYTQKSSNNK